jgi:hypothetical protein
MAHFYSTANRARHRSQRGAAVVELAPALVLLSLLTLGVLELGRGVQQFSALTAGARAAARYLATQPGSEDTIKRAQCLAVYGRAITDCGGAGQAGPIVLGLTTAQVFVGLPFPVVDDSGNEVLTATPGLASVQARTPGGTPAGTLDLVTVSIGSADQPVRFQPLLPGLIPAIALTPVSASLPVVGN